MALSGESNQNTLPTEVSIFFRYKTNIIYYYICLSYILQ